MDFFHPDTFIEALGDQDDGRVEKHLSLMYLGLDLLEMNKQLEEARAKEDLEKQISKSVKEVKNQSYPWWKLW